MTARAIGAVAVFDAVAAVGAGWFLHAEIMRLRRQTASERAAAAMLAATKARRQADEHVVLMNTLSSTVRFHQATAAQLDTRVRTLEAQLATAQAELTAMRDAEWLNSESRMASALRVVS
jgi:uncharacterized protein HemX